MDQVIRRRGRGQFIRLIPANKFEQVGKSPLVQIKDDEKEKGFYTLTNEGGFTAFDVTELWEKR